MVSAMVLASAIAMSAFQTVAAQEYITAPVSISKEKVRVNGMICYSHIVLEKQTLFSIAKAYDVTIEDIYLYNPSLKETGLKKNSILLIPSQKKNNASTAAETSGSDSSVSRSEEQKKEAAPSKETQQVKTPEKKQRTHVRKWYEDLDVIAAKYGVTVEAIMKANNLTGRKLANRQKLIIPYPGEYEQQEEIIESAEQTEIESQADSSLAETVPEWIFTPKQEVTMTLILPLKAGEEKYSRNNMDFYSGVLLAVKDLSEKGISTVLNVYDSSDQSHPVTIEDIKASDIVLGPVSSGDLKRFMTSVPAENMVVSPLDQRAEPLSGSFSNFIQAPAPHKVQYTDLLSWIKEDLNEGDKVFVISEKGARQTETSAIMNTAVDSSGISYIPYSYNILEGRDVIEPLTALMTPDATNRVFIASESEAFVNDVVRNLNILIHNKMNIVLYAPSKIRSFDTIEVENLHNVSAHVSMAYYIDYDDPEVQDFIMKYRALFNTEPTQFAFQGFDAAEYFITLCSRYGNNWYRKLGETRQSMLQSTFDFHAKENGGFVNQGIRRIVYGPKWSVSIVK